MPKDPSQGQLQPLITLYSQGQLEQALSHASHMQRKFPNSAVIYNILGATNAGLGSFAAAIDSYKQALKLKPDYAEAYNNMGNALKVQGDLASAIDSYKQALKLKPDYASAEAQLLHQLQRICDWTHIDKQREAYRRLGITTKAVSPFSMLPSEDNAERQLARSRAWVAENYKQEPRPVPARQQSRPNRLRIGYFSADFHDHPTMFLIAGLLRDHDSARFELYAYSYGRYTSGDWRKRAEGDVDHFFDVADLSDSALIKLARSHQLDVAVDLKGYTEHTRSEVFQYRLAPIQINYLGYPGSMAANFIDYILADPIVIPKDQRQHYSESVIYLPHTYQPNDDAREIAQTSTTRADFRLPKEAFVFCCFNNNYKISPREFDIWMRLLLKVEDSVLWLLKTNHWAEQNLRKEAEARGVDPLRLIFADKRKQIEHLARHKHADLFIDTFNYNAHTTASDALWAGLPVVTKIGEQFAARVSASLLQAVGLPELITDNEEDYEALILNLATNPDKLGAIKKKLAANRLSQPLFDTKRYARNFEQGLLRANDLYFSGSNAQDIWVNEE